MSCIKIIYWTVKARCSLNPIVEIIGLFCFWWQWVLLCAARQTDRHRQCDLAQARRSAWLFWSFSAHWHAAQSTQKAAEVRSQLSLTFWIASQWSLEGVPLLLGLCLWSAAGLKWGDKEEEPPQSRSLWIPCSRCELSLFLLPWFLPPRPHRHVDDGQVHSLRNHWHEKRRKSPKRENVLNHFFVAQGLRSYGAERQTHVAHKSYLLCTNLNVHFSIPLRSCNNIPFALKLKIIFPVFIVLCCKQWLSTLHKILF